MRHQWRLLLLAVGALTRLPVSPAFDPAAFRAALRFYPLVGAGVGAVGAAVFWMAAAGLPPAVAAIAALAATTLLTGALHEDGLADTADGFGGGRTAADALRIMRDSRIGTYGALALLGAGAARLGILAHLPEPGWALVAAGAASRAWVVGLARALPYARTENGGMAAGVAAPARRDVAVAGVLGLGFLLLLGPRAGAALGLSGLVAVGMALWARRRLGGYTGDVLGATQVGTELAVLGTALWRAA